MLKINLRELFFKLVQVPLEVCEAWLYLFMYLFTAAETAIYIKSNYI